MSRRGERGGARLHAQVLIVLGMLLFGGSRGSEPVDLESQVRKLVTDAARREEAAGIAADLRRELARAHEEVLGFRREVLEGLAPYEAVPGDMREREAAFDTAMWSHQERLLGLRERLLGVLTPEEWDALFEAMRAARER